MNWSYLTLLVLAALSSSTAKRSYLLTAPKVYNAGSNETIILNLFDFKESGKLHIRLLNSSGENVFSEVAVDIVDGQSKTVDLPVPAKIPNEPHYGKLQIIGSIGDYEVNRTIDITIRYAKTLVFVETDKPLYKAEQTVQIRVLAMNYNLRPQKEAKGDIWITDPNRIRIAQWLNVSLSEGLVHREFDLMEEPVLGVWTVHAKVNERDHLRSFEVKEYVLPSFEVKITPPSFVLQNAKNATWMVCAKYTYGKPVRGQLDTELTHKRQYWQKEQMVIRNSTEIDGCESITLPVDSLISNNRYYSYRELELKAEVTEEGTGTKINSTASIQPSSYAYTIARGDYDIRHFRARIPLRMTLKVTTPDSKPLAGELIKVCVETSREKWNKDRTVKDTANACKNYTSNEHGFVIFTIPPQDPYTLYIDIDVEAAEFDSLSNNQGMYRPKERFSLTPWYSRNGNHLQIQKLPKVDCSAFDPDVNLVYQFYYTFNEPETKTFYYQIMSRGEIVKHGHFDVELQEKEGEQDIDDTYLSDHSSAMCDIDGFHWDNALNSSKHIINYHHRIKLSAEMIPKARILLFTVTKDGDVVADSSWFDTDPCFSNKVEMKFGETEQSPGSKTSVHLTAEPHSLCSVGVVDKSVYILNKGDLLTGTKISGELSPLDTTTYTPPYQPTPDHEYCLKKVGDNGRRFSYDSGGYVDAVKAFADSGILVLTDLTLETRPCKKPSSGRCFTPAYQPPNHQPEALGLSRPLASPGVAGFQEADNSRNGGFAQSGMVAKNSAVVTVRTEFPETWLFDLHTIGESGESVFKETLPDSITTWEGAAVCINQDKGIGLSEPASIRAFQPFFASLTLPYSVIRNETVPIIVTVFNYLKDCLPIKVHLDQTEDYALYNGTLSKDVCVCGEESVTVRFHIRPTKIGQTNITVTAATSNDKDVCANLDISDVKRSDTITKPILVEAEGFLKEETTNTFFCMEDEESGPFKAKHSLKLPAGVIKDSARAYTSFTGDLMGPTLEGLDRLVRMPTGCGEQNMIGLVPNIVVLEYLNATGRLTDKIKEKALTNMRHGYTREQKYMHADYSYSAFGRNDKEGSMWLTAFVLRTYAWMLKHINVDETGLQHTKEWILSRQRPNGCFPMVGTVHHQAMKGGVAVDDGTTSALTAYILISLLESGYANDDVVKRSLQCLEAKSSPSNYSLALFAYAASLAGHPSASDYLKQLIDNAETQGGEIYWGTADKSIAVETAAYAMLTLLKLNRDDDFQTASAIVRWLVKQRNPYGGFHSTQDTVVGLQALGVYGARVSRQKLDMGLSIKTDRIDEIYQLNEGNELLTQRVNLRLEDDPETDVEMEASGTGCALVQTLLRYNLPTPEPSKDFELSVQTERSEDDCKKSKIRICVSSNLPNGTNMVIVETKMVSGYAPVKSTVEELLQVTELEIRRHEFKDNNVYLYFTTLTEKSKCFSFEVLQEIEVLDAKPAHVKVYDYYDNEKELSAPYAIEDACNP